MQETLTRHSVICEMAKRKAFAADSSSGKRERLPGMSDVVQAIPIGTVSVFPGFAPGNAGQNENERGREVDKFPVKISDGALFCCVRWGREMKGATRQTDKSFVEKG